MVRQAERKPYALTAYNMFVKINLSYRDVSMKKYIKIAFVYAVLAMASGVFYREFTKFNELPQKPP